MTGLITFLTRLIAVALISAPVSLAAAIIAILRYPEQFEPVLKVNRLMVHWFWDKVVQALDPGAHAAAQLRILRDGFGASAYTVFAVEVQVVVASLIIFVLLLFTQWRKVALMAAAVIAILLSVAGIVAHFK